MAQKLPRPIEDYLIGKYDNGACCYLVTKEAYKSWHQYGSSVRHLCFNNNNNKNETLVDYALDRGAKYKAFEHTKMPIEWGIIMQKSNPELYKQLWQTPKQTKSEPTPDDYYIIRNIDGGFYIVNRFKWNQISGSSETLRKPDFVFWASADSSISGLLNRDQQYWPLHNKKFPQLGSEIKKELKKLNPERYKEWEDFYCKKYPTFKRLEESGPLWVEPKSYDLNNVVILSSSKDYQPKNWENDHGTGWCFLDKTYYNNLKEGELYTAAMWSDPRYFIAPAKKGQFSVLDIPPRSYNPELYDKITKPQCGCGTCKSCLERMPLPDPKDDYIFVSSSKSGCVLIKASLNEVAKNKAVPVFDRNIWTLSTVLNGYADSWPKASPWQKEILPSELQAKFEQYYAELEQKKAPEKYNFDGKTAEMFYFYSIGKGWEAARVEHWSPTADDQITLINVRTKEMRHHYKSSLPLSKRWAFKEIITDPLRRAEFIKEAPYLAAQWGINAKSLKGSDLDIDEKAMKANWEDTVAKMKQEKRNFPLDAADYFAVRPLFNIELLREMQEYAWGAVQQEMKPSDLIKRFQETGYLLTNNSQTNKQKQHETIIVRGKTKPIIRQQVLRGTAAQGYRVEPAITTEHIAYKQRSVTSKTPAGGCKISISSKRAGNR